MTQVRAMKARTFESMIGRAGALIVGGLLVQLATCFWVDALAFVLFLGVGGALTGAGVLIFLNWLVVSRGSGPSPS